MHAGWCLAHSSRRASWKSFKLQRPSFLSFLCSTTSTINQLQDQRYKSSTMAVAGPSRLPYVELSASSGHTNGRPKSNPSTAAARVSTDVNNANSSSHGSTTQESSNPVQTSVNNGYRHISDSDDEEEEPVQVGKGTYSSSDAIVYRAIRPRTGVSCQPFRKSVVTDSETIRLLLQHKDDLPRICRNECRGCPSRRARSHCWNTPTFARYGVFR